MGLIFPRAPDVNRLWTRFRPSDWLTLALDGRSTFKVHAHAIDGPKAQDVSFFRFYHLGMR